MPFSSEIKKFRLSCLMNQTEFGNALGVSFTTVNRWEKGKARPNIKAMKYDFLNKYEQSTNIKHTAAPTVTAISVGAQWPSML